LVLAVAIAACSSGTDGGADRDASTRAPEPSLPASAAAVPQAPRMILERDPDEATAPSEDPGVAQARDPDDYVARLRRLQRAVFPGHVGPPPYQTGVTTRGVGDEVLTVGIVSTLSGAGGSLDACRGALARLERTGAHLTVDAYQEYIVERYGGQTLPYAYDASGTVNGRDIEVRGAANSSGLPCQDDGGDPAQAEARLRDLVDGQQVFAVLTPGALGVASSAVLDAAHVPYVGFGTSSAYCGTTSPYATPAPSAAVCDALPDRLVVRDVVLPSYLAASGHDPAAVQVAVIGGAADGSAVRELRLQVERAGSRVVSEQPVDGSTGAPSAAVVDRWADELDATGATLVLLLAPADSPAVVAALRAAGYTGDLLSIGPAALATAAATAFRVDGADGVSARFDSVLAPATANPSSTLIRADLDGAGFTDVALTAGVVAGWATADLFVDALTRTPEPLTAEAFANFLNGGSYAYSGAADLVCPLVLPLARVAPTPCGALSPSTDLAYYDLFLATE
jgi:branched-chain amino acid transport system substrate-binding protein